MVVSNAGKELIEAAERWRNRDLWNLSIKYLFLDGVCFNMRIPAKLRKMCWLRYRKNKNLPSAVGCLERSIDACLTFFRCLEDEWISLRTTNIIERLNKEFKRRTKSMEIVAGESACLYSPLLYLFENGVTLAIKPNWKSAI